jgi:hypothetical protein
MLGQAVRGVCEGNRNGFLGVETAVFGANRERLWSLGAERAVEDAGKPAK